MSRFAPDQLIGFALRALEEAHAQAIEAPVRPSWPLRFVLAFLAARAAERWPFDHWWLAAISPATSSTLAGEFGRRQTLNASLAGIYVQLGLDRGG